MLLINKIDQLADKNQLLPFINEVRAAFPFADILPLSARTGLGTEELLAVAARHLPQQAAFYADDEVTDRSERFLAAELLREKLFPNLGTSCLMAWPSRSNASSKKAAPRLIFAAIIVDKPQHKAIVIGKGGEKLKRMASEARGDMGKLFGGRVYLESWVKVKSGWADDERALKSLGYD